MKSVYGYLCSSQSFRIFGHLCLKDPPTYDTEMAGEQQWNVFTQECPIISRPCPIMRQSWSSCPGQSRCSGLEVSQPCMSLSCLVRCGRVPSFGNVPVICHHVLVGHVPVMCSACMSLSCPGMSWSCDGCVPVLSCYTQSTPKHASECLGRAPVMSEPFLGQVGYRTRSYLCHVLF